MLDRLLSPSLSPSLPRRRHGVNLFNNTHAWSEGKVRWVGGWGGPGEAEAERLQSSRISLALDLWSDQVFVVGILDRYAFVPRHAHVLSPAEMNLCSRSLTCWRIMRTLPRPPNYSLVM